MRILNLILIAWLLAACGGGGGGGDRPPVTNNPPPTTEDPAPTAAEMSEASKLLARTTFGPSYDEIYAAADEGIEDWLDRQLVMPPSRHEPIVRRYLSEYGFDPSANPPPGTFRRFAFYEQALTAPDQLRQLVAYSLSQIFVVSDNVDMIFTNPLGLSSYYDMLLDNAFGNFRELLEDVTLHPVMGLYLSHVNNARFNPVTNTFPDENYAREVMQLFSIGLFELNPDGSQRLDASNQPIPTYSNMEIREFSKIFTGLSYGPSVGSGPSYFGRQEPVLHVPMAMFEDYHETGQKTLLNGVVVPDGQSGMADIDDALDNLFNHPNVGPFIGRLLIQRLVTSNPSPEYVARVSAAFEGDGSTPRGDMVAVLRAILLDPEAEEGIKLREPFLRYLHLNRGLNVTSSDTTWPGYGYVAQFLTQQHVLSAPSVFNFYSPSFSPAGELADAGLTAPEFQITDASTVVGMTNLIAYALFSEQSIDSPDGFADLTLDLSDYEDLAGDPEALLDRIDLVFFASTMDSDTRNAILAALQPLGSDLTLRTQVALYLALASPAYAVQGDAS
jgi:uncharacterized protein (DUF1800 family)